MMTKLFAYTKEDHNMKKKKTKLDSSIPLDLDLKPVHLNDDGYLLQDLSNDNSTYAFTPCPPSLQLELDKTIEDSEVRENRIAKHSQRIWEVVDNIYSKYKYLERRIELAECALEELKQKVKRYESNQP